MRHYWDNTKKFFVNFVCYYLAIEIVEEIIEEFIAVNITNVIVNILLKGATALVVFSSKTGLKTLIKFFVKKITYKEGNDKVQKLKALWNWFVANKCTIGGVACGAVTAVTGAGVINVDTLPALMIGAFNITPILYGLILGALTILVSFFPETVKKYKERKEAQKAEKEEKSIVKQAKKEIAQEEKAKNQSEAQKEKEQAKAQAEQKAKEEKDKADAEYKAKVDAAKAELLAKMAEKQKAEENKQ